MNKASTIYNGKYTIDSPRGSHRTFAIKTQAKDANFAPGKRVIALLNGPDNQTAYKSFGFVTDTGITVFRKYNYHQSPYLVYAAMVWSMATAGNESQFAKMGYKLLVSKRCLKCNRELTDPVSIETGIGPVCAGREHRYETDHIDEEIAANVGDPSFQFVSPEDSGEWEAQAMRE